MYELFYQANELVPDPIQDHDQGPDHQAIQIHPENMKSAPDTGKILRSNVQYENGLHFVFNFTDPHHQQESRHAVAFHQNEVEVHVIYKCRPFDMPNHQGIDLTNIVNINTELAML